MQDHISQILTEFIRAPESPRQVHFANSVSAKPRLALQVNFPRLIDLYSYKLQNHLFL